MRLWGCAALTIGAVSVAGCAMPVAVQVAMMAGSAVSAGTTGKGLSDHAVSALTDEDCSFLHILDGQSYCLAAASRSDSVTVAIAPLASDAVPAPADRTGGKSLQAAEPAGGRSIAGTPAVFIVIGSFLNPAYAEAARARHADMPVRIAPARVRDKDWLRVIAGPYGEGEVAEARRQLSDSGVADSWSLRLCAGALTPPPCRLSGG